MNLCGAGLSRDGSKMFFGVLFLWGGWSINGGGGLNIEVSLNKGCLYGDPHSRIMVFFESLN